MRHIFKALSVVLIAVVIGKASYAQTSAPAPDTAAPVVAAPVAAGSLPAAVPPSAADVVNAFAEDDSASFSSMPLPLGALTAAGTLAPTEPFVTRSLLFTSSEVNMILNRLVQARRLSAARKPEAVPVGPDANGLMPGMEGYEPPVAAEAPRLPPIPTKRTITVSGVVYRKPGDWIVWLNGHKLVPGRLLPEIVGMQVERDRVHLKWFDIGLGKVIALTLRPHQTYDVTSGVLLTGERGQ